MSATAGTPYTRADREHAIAKLAGFVSGPSWEPLHKEAAERFWGPRPEHVPEDHYRTALFGQLEHRLKYLFWFMFDCELEGGVRAVDLLLRQGELTAGERAYLECARRGHLRLYEVREVTTSATLALEDLWTGETVRVQAQDASGLHRWDVLGARVVQGPDGRRVIDPGVYRYPPELKDLLIAWLREAHAEFRATTGRDDVVAMYREALIGLNQMWVRFVLFPEPDALTAPDGEPIVFVKAVFRVRNAARVRQVLAEHPEFEAQPDGCSTWIVTTAGTEWGCADVTLSGRRLELEAVSERWADRGRRLIEEAAGDLVRYRATRVETQEQVARAAPQSLAQQVQSGVRRLLAGEDEEALARRQEEVLRAWLDRPCDALGNRTPREAAGLAEFRPALVALLKQLENDADLQRRIGLPAHDPSWLWRELGVTP